jgi:GT2 family glycosyltransferase
MERPGVTVIMTSRERYSLTAESVANVYATTEYPFDLVYVDAGSPPAIGRRVRGLADTHGFRVVHADRLLSPNHARNLGLRYATGKYVVFVDNDVDFQPGWLEALIACAEEEDAAVVGPLYLQGPMEEQIVHMAGGDMEFRGTWGEREFSQTQRHFLKRLGDVPPEDLRRQECDIIEFHCALVRRDILDAAGWMDEGLLTTREHLDFCLRVQAVGGKIYFEPASVMTYLTPPPFALEDLSYFLVRWSDTWTRHTLTHFALKYGITPTYAERVAKTRARRQHLLTTWLRPQWERRVGKTVASVGLRFVRAAEPWYTRRLADPAYRRLAGASGRIREYQGAAGKENRSPQTVEHVS